MKISVFGLGYVGTVTAGCLADAGHDVIAVDTVRLKVDLLNAGRSPVVEVDLDRIIRQQVASGRLSATSDVREAIQHAEVAFICVGTPSLVHGGADLKFVNRVCGQIGTALRTREESSVIVVRSTVPPGSMREAVIPALEAHSGKRAGSEFGVCFNPEFLREGTAVHDYFNPPKTVIGEMSPASGDLLASLYAGMPGPLIRTDIETAELVKYADNAWHALKVGFANEIGSLCKALGMDAHRVMAIFCQDTKLNISPSYLRPGFAFGGSCLPKDLRALLYKAETLGVSAPILAAILPSNEGQIERAVRAVIEKGNTKVGILGFSFKAGTDDLRESPVVELAVRLIEKGYDLRMYDGNVSLAAIHGGNRDYILERVPNISRLIVPSIDEILDHADTIVIGNAEPEFRDVPKRLTSGQILIDLVRVCDAKSATCAYEGICW